MEYWVKTTKCEKTNLPQHIFVIDKQNLWRIKHALDTGFLIIVIAWCSVEKYFFLINDWYRQSSTKSTNKSVTHMPNFIVFDRTTSNKMRKTYVYEDDKKCRCKKGFWKKNIQNTLRNIDKYRDKNTIIK